MPVTTKLSREFYDRFGDKVVDELVGLLNNVEHTVRSELQELNDQNFRRFEERMERRLAELGADLRTEFRTELAKLRTEISGLRGEVGTAMAELKAELIKWMFLFWLGTVATMLGMGRLLIG